MSQEGRSEDRPSWVLLDTYGPQLVLPSVTVGEH